MTIPPSLFQKSIIEFRADFKTLSPIDKQAFHQSSKSKIIMDRMLVIFQMEESPEKNSLLQLSVQFLSSLNKCSTITDLVKQILAKNEPQIVKELFDKGFRPEIWRTPENYSIVDLVYFDHKIDESLLTLLREKSPLETLLSAIRNNDMKGFKSSLDSLDKSKEHLNVALRQVTLTCFSVGKMHLESPEERVESEFSHKGSSTSEAIVKFEEIARPYREMANLLRKQNEDTLLPYKEEETPLHQLAELRQGRMAEPFIKALIHIIGGADYIDDKGQSPLHKAAATGSTEIATLLLELGADLQKKDSQGQSPLHKAAERGSREMITLLKKQGAESTNDQKSNSPSHLAAQFGTSYALGALGEAHYLDKNIDGNTPLHLAAQNKNKPCSLSHLINWHHKNKKPLNTKNNKQFSPIDLACISKNNDGIALFFQHAPKETLASVLRHKDASSLSQLFARIEDQTQKEAYAKAALRQVAESSLSVGNRLLNAYFALPADQRSKAPNLTVQIEEALKPYKFMGDRLKPLLPRPLLVYEKGHETPLHHIAQKSNHILPLLEALTFILGGVDFQDDLGETPLHRAIRFGSKVAVQHCIKYSANLAIKNNQGRSALHIAAENDRHAMMHLWPNNWTLHDCDLQGNRPTHLAAQFATGQTLEALGDMYYLEKNTLGNTPLHLAAINQHETSALKHLIDWHMRNEYELDVLNNMGQSPLDLAQLYNNSAAAFLLQNPKQKNAHPMKGQTAL